jgi:hypothetical protein
VLTAGDGINVGSGTGVISTCNERARLCRSQTRGLICTLARRLSPNGITIGGVRTVLAGETPVELELQSAQHAPARVAAVDARADDALAADRFRAEDVPAHVGALAVGGHRDVGEDEVGTGAAGDGRRGTAEAAVRVCRERADPVIPIPAVECPGTVRVIVVGDESVIAAEPADAAWADQDIEALVPHQHVVARR